MLKAAAYSRNIQLQLFLRHSTLQTTVARFFLQLALGVARAVELVTFSLINAAQAQDARVLGGAQAGGEGVEKGAGGVDVRTLWGVRHVLCCGVHVGQFSL